LTSRMAKSGRSPLANMASASPTVSNGVENFPAKSVEKFPVIV